MKTIEQFKSEIADTIEAMSRTMQNPKYHGEGDVWSHTQMAMDEMHGMDEYKVLSDNEKTVLDYACLLHDVGKIPCTRIEDGEIVSRGHSIKGEEMARRLLWRAGFNGSLGKMHFRESVCALVRMHGRPPHFWDKIEAYEDVKWIQQMALHTPASMFNLKLLWILSRADWNGRICNEKDDGLVAIDLFADKANECGCFDSRPYCQDDYNRYLFLNNECCSLEAPRMPWTTCNVTIMSGLPASGKTTWIQRNKPDMSVVSLDEIRRRLEIKPTGNQGLVIQTGFEEAREHLRKHKPFVWDATCLNYDMRRKIVGICMDYSAMVDIVYLELNDEERMKRNRSREYAVPDDVMEKMVEKVAPPTFMEAHGVIWIPTSEY